MDKKQAIEAIYPLSPTQEGILFHTLYAPQSGLYFQHLSYGLRGELDVAAFQEAWRQVVERHPVLRTSFSWEKRAQPLQIVHRQVRIPWDILDWRDADADLQQVQLDAFLAADRARGFRLTRPPLLRLALIRLAADRWQFVWSFHHLILDGWSLAVVVREVMALYGALAAGQSLRLAPVRPYRDYVVWLQGQDPAAAEAFWHPWLAGVEEPTVLGIDRTPGAPPSQEAVYGEVDLALDAEQTAALRTLARRAQVTLNTVVQAAWALLLGHYSGSRDVVFGTTVSGRTAALPGMDDMVGLFINTLPVRVAIPRRPMLEWLPRLQAQQSQLQQHQHTPLVQVQSWSAIPRGTPLFDSVLVFENYPVDTSLRQWWQGGGRLEVTDLYPTPERTNFPLSVTAFLGERLEMRIFYETHRFEEAAMARLTAHLRTLLCAIATEPERLPDALPLLSAEERAELAIWNSTDCPLAPADATLHRWVLAQAQRTPDAPAIRFDSDCLSYAQLARLSERLAARLLALGCRSDRPVAVLLPRSLWLPVALLAVLRAGSFYLPLEPGLPTPRLAELLADAQPTVLLTLTPHVPTDCPLPVLRLDCDDWQQSPHHPLPEVPASQPANLLYTSGSTGTPKGVINSHRGLVNRLLWMQRTYPLTPTDRVLHKTPVSFDVSGWELWWPLMVGAQLVVAPPGVHTDPAMLLSCIAQTGATVVHFVPAMLALVLAEPRLGALGGSLRLVFASGEALDLALADRFRQGLRGARLHNLYGPTEAAIDVSYQDALAEDFAGCRTVPIGRPIANVQLHVLDERMQPVVVGVPGEIYIGGVGLAQGYWRRPEQTAERFVPDPFGPPGGRLYRTGDRGRWLADGRIEYLGRLDAQVKLRGVRIELGEVEAQLLREPGVRQAAAVVGGAQLVGFVVGEVDGEAIRQSLRERLPEALVPGWLSVVASLPTTASGKVNRRTLAEWAVATLESRRHAAGTISGAQTPVEAAVARAWCEVLGLESVGREEDFFALGGHSLLATRLVARLRETFDVELSLRTLFEGHATVAALARTIEQYEFDRADPVELAAALAEVEALSDEDVAALLAQREVAA